MLSNKEALKPFLIIIFGVFVPFGCIPMIQIGGIIGAMCFFYLVIWVIACTVFMFYMLFISCKHSDEYSSF